MIPNIKELNFPSYATLSQATITLNDMGDRTISAQVEIDGSIAPDFSYDWVVEFKGERYIQPLRQPQASKGVESRCSTIDLVFYHKTIWQLKRYYFVEIASTNSGTAIADQYIASLNLNLSGFCVAFQEVLDHYFDGQINIDLNPNLNDTKGVQFMSISYSHIWDVLQKVYEVYGVRWTIEGNTIKVGYPTTVLSHTFQYGYEGGLLQVERQVQDANIRNSLLGRGGEQNLPVYYFKEAPEGSLFASDPDAIPELANIYFSNLRGKTFRDYVKGWKAHRYGGESMAEPTDEYLRGYTDSEKSTEEQSFFNPIEYVEDKESIEKYGLLQGALDNNEEIYPSIQGAPNGEDVVVYVEPITSDDVEESVSKAETISLKGMSQFRFITREQNGGNIRVTLQSEVFEVLQNSYALNIGNDVSYNIYRGFTLTPIWEGNPLVEVEEIVTNKDTNQVADKSSLSKGRYQVVTTFNITLPIYEEWPAIGATDNISFDAKLGVSTNLELRKLQDSTTTKWLPTFNIWVKNIWGSTRKSGESKESYAERVWRPILGDRQGKEAKVVFASGWLSGHEDYEFTIVDFAYDNSHKYNGSQSEWRLTLAKSDAELEATGKYIPSASTNGQAYAGDKFFFLGIDMPHQYVLWAEERVDNWKRGEVDKTSEIQPKWVVRFDKVRMNEGDTPLIDQIEVGGAINLADVRFISAPSMQLYLQSVTYTWNEQTSLYPDIEVVLADTIVTVQNPVARLQGSIDAINSQLHNIGNIAQVVRKIGDSLYLRKDGVEDVSKSPTKFVGNISGNTFRRGKVGGADWGIYRDENGNAIAEFDKIIARKDFEVNNLVINQVSYIGGMQITSAASIEVTRVIENDNYYQCFFDQKGGSVANLFQVNDIAYSQRFDESNNTTKYYKRVVVATGVDFITLSKMEADGEGVPMGGDLIVHYGNTEDSNRQYVVIRDVIGGGYERMLSDLNSVSAEGVEYYFAGRMDGNTPRWFVGDKENHHIEYKDGKLNIKSKVRFEAGSTGAQNIVDLPNVIKNTIGDITLGDFSIGKNILMNSGFTGDYLSTNFDATKNITSKSNVYSESFKYWDFSNCIARESAFSQSGVEVVITNGELSQTIKEAIIAGDNYIFSIYAKGELLQVSIGGFEQEIELKENYDRYILRFTAQENSQKINIKGYAELCMPQLERGNIVTAWGLSVYDNDKTLAYYQQLQYLASAIKDGSVDILGGLILANMILLGNYQDGEMKEVTAGVSGIYNDSDDVAFWAGGAMEKAITTVRRFRENPRYQPTDAEWADMASFVATHGGDLFLKGYIFALGGFFRGTVSMANGKIQLNEDGSGSLADKSFVWDKEGRVMRNYPDIINWIPLTNFSNGIIDHSLGGYFEAVGYSGNYEFILPTPPFAPYKIVFRGPRITTRSAYPAYIHIEGDGAFSWGPVSVGGNAYRGTTMVINATAGQGDIEVVWTGDTFEVNTPINILVGGEDSLNVNIQIY